MDAGMAEVLAEIKSTIATVTTKLDMLIQRIDPTLMDHEKRIRSLEQWRWRVAGGAALAGGILGGGIAGVLQLLGG